MKLKPINPRPPLKLRLKCLFRRHQLQICLGRVGNLEKALHRRCRRCTGKFMGGPPTSRQLSIQEVLEARQNQPGDAG